MSRTCVRGRKGSMGTPVSSNVHKKTKDPWRTRIRAQEVLYHGARELSVHLKQYQEEYDSELSSEEKDCKGYVGWDLGKTSNGKGSR